MIRILFRKELLDSLRDRRTLLMMLVLPALLYPGTLLLTGSVMAAGKERLAREELVIAVASDDALSFLTAQPAPAHTTFTRMSRAEGEAGLKDKKVAAVADAPEGSFSGLHRREQAVLTVAYTRRYDRSMEALDRLRKVLDGFSKAQLSLRLTELQLPATFAEPLKLEATDVDFQKNLGPLIASRTLPIMLVLMLLMGALYPAVDLTAGEKERGTLETLLVAPVRPLQVMFAKYLTVALVATLATLANLTAMAVTFGMGLTLDATLSTQMVFSAGQLATLVLCFIPTAFLVSGIALAVASLAKSFKEGQSLMTPIVLIGTVPGMIALMPGVELTWLTSAIPLLNVALLVKAVILGAANPGHLAVTVVSTAVCSLFTLRLAANAFASEALRFGGSAGWKDLFRFR